MLDRSGHFPHQEQPQLFAERVSEFMTGTRL
jgi:pimeloyl-ACP methyl ester carboxylesterase